MSSSNLRLFVVDEGRNGHRTVFFLRASTTPPVVWRYIESCNLGVMLRPCALVIGRQSLSVQICRLSEEDLDAY